MNAAASDRADFESESESMKRLVHAFVLVALTTASASGAVDPEEQKLRSQAATALRRACRFFDAAVSTEGSYLWRYSEDLSRREGEGPATATMGWVQPPGTPSVGLAYLDAYAATGERIYLDAARATAHALVRTQLESGGWDYRIYFDPEGRAGYAYRAHPKAPPKNGKLRNVTTLDDNNTQQAVRFLMRIDAALKPSDREVHDAVEYALSRLSRAQYPNGAWPQRFDALPDPGSFPVMKARYPESWSRTWPGKNYRAFYTFNDNAIADMVDVMLEAADRYDNVEYRRCAERAGDFILLAQMPEPQPAWAQQYDLDMRPAWARKFEPPAVTGGESIGVMRTLLQLYRHTGAEKYLEPIPRALRYLEASRRPDGRLARFYELRTNRPLYFTKDYRLSYSDADMPTHYGFIVADRTGRVREEYERVRKLGRSGSKAEWGWSRPRLSDKLRARVRSIIEALDARGAWVEPGVLRTDRDDSVQRIIQSRTFIDNVAALSDYLAAGKKK